MNKLKTYVLRVSKYFLKDHPRAGQETFFKEKILTAHPGRIGKIHTIRSNYDYWKHVADEVNAGRGVLSLRQWNDTPFRSKQGEFMKLYKMDVQRCKVTSVSKFSDNKIVMIGESVGLVIDMPVYRTYFSSAIATNDGLSEEDFNHWFQKDFDGCIIYFSDYRY